VEPRRYTLRVANWPRLPPRYLPLIGHWVPQIAFVCGRDESCVTTSRPGRSDFRNMVEPFTCLEMR